jgi:hypothetical protein
MESLAMAHDAALIEAIGVMLAEQEQTLSRALAEIDARLAALPVPPPGQPGENGLDGVDRILAAPMTIAREQRCARNDIVHHAAGLWQAIRETSGDPDHDPAGWKCLVPGVSMIETGEDWPRREMVARFRMSDGVAHECRWRMPATYLPADWRQRGWGIIAGDILREGDSDFIALIDMPGDPLADATASNWQKMTVIGRRGRPGEPGRKGDDGNPGPGLEALTIVRDPTDSHLAILPVYGDKRIAPKPITIDLLAEPAPPGRSVIIGYAGGWHSSKRYGRGDVVSGTSGDQKGLWLSLAPENHAPLNNASAWERMV